MRFRLVLLVVGVVAVAGAQLMTLGAGAGGSQAGGGPSYLLSEDFEGASACGDSVGTNCQLTWTKVSSPTSTFNYATSPAPLEGSFAALLGHSGDIFDAFSHTFTAQDTVYFFFIIDHKVLVGGAQTFLVTDGSDTALWALSNANPEWRVHCGTVNTFSTAITQGTTYYVWGDYTKGTGANAVCHLYTSTTTTKPGSANITISNGDATTQGSKAFIRSGAATEQTIFDKIRVSASSIGSNPS